MHLLNSGNPPPCDDSDHAGQWPKRVDLSRRMDFGRMTVFGAERKLRLEFARFRFCPQTGHPLAATSRAWFARAPLEVLRKPRPRRIGGQAPSACSVTLYSITSSARASSACGTVT